MVPVWLNATLELQFYNLKELPIYKDGIPELPFYKEGHHFIKMFLINWLYPGSVSNYKFDVLVHFFVFFVLLDCYKQCSKPPCVCRGIPKK
jgi:hypothetical protein